MFTTEFDSFTCDGDRIECHAEGFTCIAWTERDDNGDAPDERQYGFWPSKNPEDCGWCGSVGAYPVQKARATKIMDLWLADEWDYCGVCVRIFRDGVPLTGKYDNALWGVERNYPKFLRSKVIGRDKSYLAQTANELLGEALTEARAKLASLCECAQHA